jgi:hypothetical protein
MTPSDEAILLAITGVSAICEVVAIQLCGIFGEQLWDEAPSGETQRSFPQRKRARKGAMARFLTL